VPEYTRKDSKLKIASKVFYKGIGTVVHHVKNDGTGIWFKKIDERKEECIRKYLSEHN